MKTETENYTAESEIKLKAGGRVTVRRHKRNGDIEAAFQQVTDNETLSRGDIIRPDEIAD